ncbi:hypothetical protein Tco_0310626, partial [Tanacetum coccineum]
MLTRCKHSRPTKSQAGVSHILETQVKELVQISGVPDEVKGTSKAKADRVIDWGSEDESDYSTESDELKGVEKEKINEEEIELVSIDKEDEQQDDQDDDDDEEIKDVGVAETGKD